MDAVPYLITGDLDGGALLCDPFDEQHSKADGSGRHVLMLAPYMHKWFRVGGPDIARHQGVYEAVTPVKE